ncbi:MAG: RecX family transcriptional regulator [Clostridia bacterium]|nr:RecX family transcriptional regulator [Clostridia bacterium]
MKILEIRPRRKQLSGIIFDCEINPKEWGADPDAAGYLSLDSELCEIKGLKAGMSLTDEQLEDLICESHTKRAISRAMWYLSRSDCSRATLIEKLSKAFPEYASETAADRMEELGFLNDEKYARHKFERILAERKVSVGVAKQMLRLEGIDRELIDIIAEEIDVDPIEPIVELIEKKYKHKLGGYEQNKKVIAALMRKGHKYPDIKEALARFDVENDEYYSEDYDV